jgi:hypothetical protein
MTQRATEPGESTPKDTERDLADEHEAELGEGEFEDEEDGPRRRWTADAVIPWALVAALVLIGLALLWNAGEQHYQGCVSAVGVRTAGDNSPLGRFARQDVKKCTRSPF